MIIQVFTPTLEPEQAGQISSSILLPIDARFVVRALDGSTADATVTAVHESEGCFYFKIIGPIWRPSPQEPPQAAIPDDVPIDPDDDGVVCWGDAAVGGEALEGAVDTEPAALPTCERCGRMLLGPCTAHTKVKLR